MPQSAQQTSNTSHIQTLPADSQCSHLQVTNTFWWCNHSDTEVVQAHTTIFDHLQHAGFQPIIQCFNNEASTTIKTWMHACSIQFQLVPPHVHHQNAAEQAISTFKNHFIAGLASMDPNFPLQYWDKLLPQAELTLNLLCSSWINPQLSTYAQLFGAFDYNKTPLAPPGIHILAHEKPNQCSTWAPHGAEGWYIGPAMDHYQCYTIVVTEVWHMAHFWVSYGRCTMTGSSMGRSEGLSRRWAG